MKFWKRSHLPHDDIDELRVQGLVEGRGHLVLITPLWRHWDFKIRSIIKANSLIIADTHGCHFRNYASQKIEWRPTIFCSLRVSPFF